MHFLDPTHNTLMDAMSFSDVHVLPGDTVHGGSISYAGNCNEWLQQTCLHKTS